MSGALCVHAWRARPHLPRPLFLAAGLPKRGKLFRCSHVPATLASVRFSRAADHAGAHAAGEVPVLTITESTFALVAVPHRLAATTEDLDTNPAVGPLAGFDLLLRGPCRHLRPLERHLVIRGEIEGSPALRVRRSASGQIDADHSDLRMCPVDVSVRVAIDPVHLRDRHQKEVVTIAADPELVVRGKGVRVDIELELPGCRRIRGAEAHVHNRLPDAELGSPSGGHASTSGDP